MYSTVGVQLFLTNRRSLQTNHSVNLGLLFLRHGGVVWNYLCVFVFPVAQLIVLICTNQPVSSGMLFVEYYIYIYINVCCFVCSSRFRCKAPLTVGAYRPWNQFRSLVEQIIWQANYRSSICVWVFSHFSFCSIS